MAYAVTNIIEETFSLSPDESFDAPFVADLTQAFQGYQLIPGIERVTGTTANWPEVGAHRQIHTKLGTAHETITVRDAPRVGEYEVVNLGLPFADRIDARWTVQPVGDTECDVTWSYTLTTSRWWWYPILIIFVRTQVAGMMRQAMSGIKKQALDRHSEADATSLSK